MAEQLGGLLAVLRTALEEGDPAAPQPDPPAAPGAASGRRVQRIPVERVPAGVAVTVVLTIGVDVGGTRASGPASSTPRARSSTPPATPPRAARRAGGRGGRGDRRARGRGTGSARSGWPWPGSSPRTGAASGSRRTWPGGTRRWPTGSSTRLGLPVVVEHDANAAALAERRFGAAAGASTVVFIALGTGIGSALLLDGELFRGAFGVAPELGHIRVVPDGRPCPCGKNGCWERYCSGTALATTAVELLARDHVPVPGARPARRGDPGRVTGHGWPRPPARATRWRCAAMAELARWLGEGLALVADMFDPELMVIGGGVSESAPLFLDEAREHYAARLTGPGGARWRGSAPRSSARRRRWWGRRSWPASAGRPALTGPRQTTAPSSLRAAVGGRPAASGQSRSTSQPSPAASATRPSGSP